MPDGIRAVIVHPHMFLSTKQARAILKRTVDAVGLRLADRQSRRLHLRLLHQRPGHDPRVVRGRGHRAAAPGADPGLSARCARRPWRPARWAARSPARARRCLPGPGARRRAVREAMAGRVRAARTSRVDDWIVAVQVRRRAHAASSSRMTFTARAARHRQVDFSAGAASRAWRRTAACTCPDDWPHLRCRCRRCEPALAGRRLAGAGARFIAPFAAGDRAGAAAAARSRAEAFNFPAPLVPLDARCAPARARAVSRPHRGVQGFRRALPRGLHACRRVRPSDRAAAASWWRPRATPAARWRRPSTPAGHRGRRCCFRRAWCRRRRSTSSPAGATMCTRSRRARHLRRLPAHGEGSVRSMPQLRAACELSSANSINLGRLLPQAVYYAASEPRDLARSTASARRSSFRAATSATSVACVWARKVGPADRRHRAGAQRQPHRAGLSRQRANGSRAPSIATLASAMDVGNPSNMERLRALFPDIAANCAGRPRAVHRGRRRDPRAHPRRLRSLRPGLVPAHGHRGRGLRAAAGASAREGPLGAGVDGASGEVPRDRRAADRSRDPGA